MRLRDRAAPRTTCAPNFHDDGCMCPECRPDVDEERGDDELDAAAAYEREHSAARLG